jgi:hypothetical protein
VLSICQSLPGLAASNTEILVGDRLHSKLRDWNSDVAHAYSEKAGSQLLTLYTTPVVYIYLDEFSVWFEGQRHRLLARWSARMAQSPNP